MLFPHSTQNKTIASRIRKHPYKTAIILRELQFNALKIGVHLNYIQGSIFYLTESLVQVYYKDQAITVCYENYTKHIRTLRGKRVS